MNSKDETIKQLRSEIKDLRKQITLFKMAEKDWVSKQKELLQSVAKLRLLLKTAPARVLNLDLAGNVLFINHTKTRHSINEVLGRNAYDFILKKDREKAKKNLGRALSTGFVKNIEYMHLKRDGTEFPAETSASIFHDASGKLAGFVIITKDISVRKKAEEALIRSEAELRQQKLALEEKNIALREIIAQIEIEKRKIKEDIDTNVDLVIAPILDQLRSNKDNHSYINLLQHHLIGLTSSFGHKITDNEINLTPREIEICNIIKGGTSSKDISKMLNISSQTVERHRKNIRHKLGIANRRVNLTSYLRNM